MGIEHHNLPDACATTNLNTKIELDCVIYSRCIHHLSGNYIFFMEKTNERSGHLMVSDYRRPRPRVTPEDLHVHCRPLKWVGRRSPALPDAKCSGIKPLLHAGFKGRGWF